MAAPSQSPCSLVTKGTKVLKGAYCIFAGTERQIVGMLKMLRVQESQTHLQLSGCQGREEELSAEEPEERHRNAEAKKGNKDQFSLTTSLAYFDGLF